MNAQILLVYEYIFDFFTTIFRKLKFLTLELDAANLDSNYNCSNHCSFRDFDVFMIFLNFHEI